MPGISRTRIKILVLKFEQLSPFGHLVMYIKRGGCMANSVELIRCQILQNPIWVSALSPQAHLSEYLG